MRIYARKRDDILRRQSEYEADKAQRKQQYAEQYRSYNDALRDAHKPVLDFANSIIREAGLDPDSMRISVETRWGSNVALSIRDEQNVHDENKSISWSVLIELNPKTGELTKESSSWSGLRATEPKHIEHLKKVVNVLEEIVNADWATVLNISNPEYSDYVTMRDPNFESAPENYAQLLDEADIEDVMGDRYKLVKGSARFDYHIVSETDKFYKVVSIPKYALEYVDRGDYTYDQVFNNNYMDGSGVERISKEKFFNDLIKRPVTIIDCEGK